MNIYRVYPLNELLNASSDHLAEKMTSHTYHNNKASHQNELSYDVIGQMNERKIWNIEDNYVVSLQNELLCEFEVCLV
jgi:hypothetical protein